MLGLKAGTRQADLPSVSPASREVSKIFNARFEAGTRQIDLPGISLAL